MARGPLKDRLGGLLEAERATLVVCAVAIAAGVALRVHDLGFPAHLTFDERHFVVKGARNYLERAPDLNHHPPLGSLLVAASIALFGDVSWAWRVPSCVAGIANIGLAGALAGLLFRSRVAIAVTAALVAMDGFFLSYSRTALIDGGLVAWMLASAFFLLRARSAGDLALASIFAGLCASTKFTGIVLVPPILLSVVAHRRRLPWWTVSTVGLMPLAYWCVYALGLSISRQPIEVLADTKRIYDINAGLTAWVNPVASHWPTWFLPVRTMPLSFVRTHRTVRTMTSLPNLAVGWGSALLAFAALARLATLGPRRLLARIRAAEPGFFRADLGAVAWLVLLWGLPIVPWTLTARDSYHNHYLPSYAFAVVLLGGGLTRLLGSKPLLGGLAMAVIVVVFVLYAPVFAQLPVDVATYERLLFLESWRIPHR